MFPLVYEELRAAAGRLMAGERADHTLQRTALVHEAYAKLAKGGATFADRAHFFNAAAQAMRRILVDHALARGAKKRGGGRRKLDLDDVNVPPQESGDRMDWLALDEAMTKLTSIAPRRAQIVSLKYFVGLSEAEIAELLGMSELPVRRAWIAARAWLYQQMRDDEGADPS
jgi:RNA polymerase sigma factor (TIGR02999 family)